MAQELHQKPNQQHYNAKVAFVCGLLSHVAMDSCFHPLIYHITGNYYSVDPRKQQQAKWRHWIFEKWLNHRLVIQYEHKKSWKTIQAMMRHIKRQAWSLIDFYTESLAQTWTFDFSLKEAARRAFSLQYTYNRVTHSGVLLSLFDWSTRYVNRQNREILFSCLSFM